MDFWFSTYILNGNVLLRRGLAFLIDLSGACAISYMFVLINKIFECNLSSIILCTPVIILVFLRDIIVRSPGKAIMHLMIIDSKTKTQAAFFKRMVRGITLPLWPIEAIVCFVTNGSRMIDLVLHTKVISDHDLITP